MHRFLEILNFHSKLDIEIYTVHIDDETRKCESLNVLVMFNLNKFFMHQFQNKGVLEIGGKMSLNALQHCLLKIELAEVIV